ncbi:hypothetical protein K488DRAFT_12764, partial [Vararia minispora EC-137]
SLPHVFHHFASTEPRADFLVEDRDVALSYSEAYALAAVMLPRRLAAHLAPPTSRESAYPSVMIVSPNNTMLLLSILAIWQSSAVAVPVQPRVEADLLAGMISIVKPALILVLPSLLSQVESCTSGLGIPIVSFFSLFPEGYEIENSAAGRVSNFIPACKSWLRSTYPRNTHRSLSQLVSENPPPHLLSGDDKAITMFTSSAVDRATLKCVTYTHKFLIGTGTRTALSVGSDVQTWVSRPVRHLGWMPLAHAFELGVAFCGTVLPSGGCYVFFDSTLSSPTLPPSTSLAQHLLTAFAYYGRVTSFTAPPLIADEIMSICSGGDLIALEHLKALECFIVAGSHTPEPVFQWMASLGIKYTDCYGLTEIIWAAHRRAQDPVHREHGFSICPGLSGVIRKEDEEDSFGELIVLGEDLPTCYDNIGTSAFSSYANVTVYRTGDIFKLSHNIPRTAYIGRDEEIPEFNATNKPLQGLTYIGRKDDIVVLSTGEKVDSLAVEQVILQDPRIESAVLVANCKKDSLAALVKLRIKPDSSVDWDDLRDAILRVNTLLPFEKRLRRELIFFVDELPLTPKRSINRKLIRKIISCMESDSDFPSNTPPPSFLDASLSEPTIPDLQRRVCEVLVRTFDVPYDLFVRNLGFFDDLPLTSLAAVELVKALQREFGVEISAAAMYGVHNVEELCTLVASKSISAHPLSSAHSSHPSVLPIRVPPAQNSSSHVITGAACRFVGGIESMTSLWSALAEPDLFLKMLSTDRPPSRFTEQHIPQGPSLCPSAFLDDSAVGLRNVQSFADFFRISLRDAEAMSPNARLALQLGYEAIEDACVAPGSLRGQAWGVFTALNESGWRLRREGHVGTEEYARDIFNMSDDAAAGRLAHFLDLTGPAIDIKTACSSSAVAIHQGFFFTILNEILACAAIQNGDCEAAVVISVTTHFHPSGTLFRSFSGIASPSGTCLPFSEWADGTLPSEGAAAIVIQKARNVQVSPYASIRGSAVTHDGASRGFLSPNPVAQIRLLRLALDRANIMPDDLCFVEAHGTGTKLGDDIELHALKEVFENRKEALPIGSLKGVIGHTEECAGLAGVLKALLCFSHCMLPAQPFTGSLHKIIDETDTPLTLPSHYHALHSSERQGCRIGVSSFGLSGTLAHLILEHPPASVYRSRGPQQVGCEQLFLISAKNATDFRALAARYLRSLAGSRQYDADLAAVCAASQLCRDHHVVRQAFVVGTWRDLAKALRQASIEPAPRPLLHMKPRVGLWFSSPLNIAASNEQPNPKDTQDLGPAAFLAINGTLGADSACWHPEFDFFARCSAFAKTLIKLGINVSAVGGEGEGEYAAGVFAGVLPVSSVFRHPRAETQQDCSSHVLLAAVIGGRDALEQHIALFDVEEATIVGRHAEDIFLVRGTGDALAALSRESDLRVVIQANSASETSAFDVDCAPSLSPPRIPLISGHLSEVLDQETSVSPRYWAGVRARFVDTPVARTALARECDIIVDMGTAEADQGPNEVAVGGKGELEVLARLYEMGCEVDWGKVSPDTPKARLP